jgi:hypothetical protein
MAKRKETALMKKYRERVHAAGLPAGVTVSVRVTGGMPSERIEQQFELTGEGKVATSRLNEAAGIPFESATGQVSPDEARQLLQEIEAGLPSMVRRGEARFLPDSVVGIVTVQVDGKEETLFFPVEEGGGPEIEAAAVASMEPVLKSIKQISDRLLKESRGQPNE